MIWIIRLLLMIAAPIGQIAEEREYVCKLASPTG
jgi:hypothetical protein